MGAVSTVNFTRFPIQNPESLDKQVSFVIKLADGSDKTLRGVIVRSDAETPNREIVRLDDDQFNDNTTHYMDSLSFKNHPEHYDFLGPVTSKHCYEGKTVQVFFHGNLRRVVRGTVIFDRGPLTLIRINEGFLEGKIINATECHYSVERT